MLGATSGQFRNAADCPPQDYAAADGGRFDEPKEQNRPEGMVGRRSPDHLFAKIDSQPAGTPNGMAYNSPSPNLAPSPYMGPDAGQTAWSS